MKSLPITTCLLCALLLSGCGIDDDEGCESFDEVTALQKNTDNGIPRGYYRFIINGSLVESYPSNLPAVLSGFSYWRSLYRYYCENHRGARYYDGYRYRSDLDDALENAYHYGLQLQLLYRNSWNVILSFDGVSNFTITRSRVDPDSTVMPFSFLTITDLTAFDIGTDITLNDTTANRIFRIDHSSDLFSSIESGSSLKMKIHSIRPVGQSTEVEIQGPGILFNDAGNMESVIIEGTVSAYREKP